MPKKPPARPRSTPRNADSSYTGTTKSRSPRSAVRQSGKKNSWQQSNASNSERRSDEAPRRARQSDSKGEYRPPRQGSGSSWQKQGRGTARPPRRQDERSSAPSYATTEKDQWQVAEQPENNLPVDVAFGFHSVRAALQHSAQAVRTVWLDEDRHDRRANELRDLARRQGVQCERVSASRIEQATPNVNHQGVIAWVKAPVPGSEKDLTEILDKLDHPPLLLVLDSIQDPHNLGACLRTAEAVGVDAVIAPRDHMVGLTPIVCKVASGAASIVPFIQVSNLARTLETLRARGIWFVGSSGEAEQEIYAANLQGPLALVMGAEGTGLRRLTSEYCDLLVKLPMLGQIESLNVSVAAGVCLYEALRQRRTL